MAQDAIHDYRERRPPPSNRPPPEFVSALPAPAPRRSPTLQGMPAPPAPGTPVPPPREKLDSREVANETLLAELAAKGAEVREAEAAKAAAEAKLAAYERAPALPLELPTRSHWAALLYKLGGALVAILVPCGVYLTYRVETLVPRVDSAQNRQQTQQQAAATIEDRVKALESYNRALMAHSDCVDAQRDSAIERGTGHAVEGSHSDVDWFQQNRPVLKLRVLWETSPWYITTPCPPKPHPPGTP